jgi:endonuclease/exonuclease/phosphatase family metal-dependent hydrolase
MSLINPQQEHQHELTEHAGKNATCTKQGYKTYYTCSCGKAFSDSEAKNEISTPVVIDALGHDYVLDATGKLIYDDATDYYDASGLAVKIVCDRCHIVNAADSKELEYFSVKPSEEVENSYIISAESNGQTYTGVYGVKVESTDCVCDSFKLSGTLGYDAEEGTIDTSGLVISDATCKDCGKAITTASVDVSGAFTDGLVVYCGGASVTLPALNLDNYTVVSAKTGGNDPAPILTTTFTSSDASFVCNVTTYDFFYANETIYSRYELSLLDSDSVKVTYEDGLYIYDAISPVTLTKEIRTYGTMLVITGEVTLNLSARWTHNNGVIFGSADKSAKVTSNVNATKEGNAIFFWDGADMIINEGSTLELNSSDPYTLWTGSKGTHITVDGKLISNGHVFISPDIDFVHPEGDYYNSNPNLYIRKGSAEINGNLLVNFIQVGSVENDYTGKLTVNNGYIGCYSNTGADYNKPYQIRWIFSKGELNFANTGSSAITNAMKTDQNYQDRVIAFDSEIAVNVSGSYNHLLAHAWGSYTTLAIHSGAKFKLPAETNVYNHENTYSSVYSNAWNEATVTIDGEEKTVWVAGEHFYKENEKLTLTQDDLLSVVNDDGTRSAARISAFGSYTTTDGESRVGDWLFKKAIDENGNVIYYYVVDAHVCENACIQCGKCFNTDCTEEVCKAKCSCYSDEVLGKVDDGFIYNLMSFNISTLASESNPVNNWESRKEAVVSFINNSRAHIIGLQEVRKSQFDYINNNLSDKYVAVYFPREGGDNPEGLAIVLDATVFNIVSDDRYWLSDTPDVQSKGWGESYYRIALVLVLENKLNGEFVKTINTHGPLEDVANTNAYKLIMDRSVNENDPFVFLCGDFNATEGAIGYVPVADELQDCRVTADESPNRGHITYQGWGSYVDGETPEHIIDFCFVSKGDDVDVLSYCVRTDKWGADNMLSDHYAIQTTVLVKK